MDFFELVEKRYSVRAYLDQPVEEEKLNKVLEAARLAPTAANRQPFRILVVTTEGRKEELKRLYPRDWFVQAPYIIGICALPSEGWVRRDGRNYAVVDATIAMDHLILAAASLGLGTCWVAAFNEAAAKEIFQ
ncbi:MAG: nitroreductase family protein, partial [Candidatus Aminicenantes bacterium]|nr:nitroreductase family protein [Candidatus Aminicenantes bacterium]